ncbi:MSHA biogenesis protein MshP [Vibrio ponticus]|uniref:MSHA biogenesis protein MshP n=1 Tax=Vibrio ponticus TaxID=265668 RepID=A0A3N3DY40_9VIBR|nr:MSHA biogenesis protein MshP [Vibrio ponticus]OLQ94311.1 MSHA biogenesis protein MshP [Vibrio ponticus]ROV59270.1 MSHA biogenesis protein MshP [Vibrio ponticus]
MRKFSMVNNRQQGSALVVILFVMVIGTFFAAQLINMNTQSSQANTYETLSTRAYWAARSLAERLVYELVPVEEGRTASCLPSYQLAAFPSCTIEASCVPNEEATIVTSTATCSVEAYRVSRRFEVEVRP